MISDEEKDLVAQQQLGLDESWTMVYTAIDFQFLHDTGDVHEEIDYHRNVEAENVEEALQKQLINVELPKGWRLVGLRKKNGNSASPRKYGLVDFSSLGAA